METKRERIITKGFDEATQIIWFEVAGEGRLELDLGRIHEDVRGWAQVHGFTQRVIDAAALGKGATAAEKFAEMARIVGHYNEGNETWDLPRAEGSGPRNEVAMAVARLMKKDIAAIIERAKNEAAAKGVGVGQVYAAWAALGVVGKEIERMRAERAKATGIDAGALAEELAALGEGAPGE